MGFIPLIIVNIRGERILREIQNTFELQVLEPSTKWLCVSWEMTKQSTFQTQACALTPKPPDLSTGLDAALGPKPALLHYQPQTLIQISFLSCPFQTRC